MGCIQSYQLQKVFDLDGVLKYLRYYSLVDGMATVYLYADDINSFCLTYPDDDYYTREKILQLRAKSEKSIDRHFTEIIQLVIPALKPIRKRTCLRHHVARNNHSHINRKLRKR